MTPPEFVYDGNVFEEISDSMVRDLMCCLYKKTICPEWDKKWVNSCNERRACEDKDLFPLFYHRFMEVLKLLDLETFQLIKESMKEVHENSLKRRSFEEACFEEAQTLKPLAELLEKLKKADEVQPEVADQS